MFLREQYSTSGLVCMGWAPVPFSPVFASTKKTHKISQKIFKN
jgi:hypothetical protein